MHAVQKPANLLGREALQTAMDTIHAAAGHKRIIFVAHYGTTFHLPLLKEELARFGLQPIPHDAWYYASSVHASQP